MVKYSKKRNLNNRKVTRRNSKKRNNLKKNTRKRKVSKKGGAAENTPKQVDYDDFFEFLICIKANPQLLDKYFPRSQSRTLCVQKKHLSLKFFPNLTPNEFQDLFTYYAEHCYEVSEDKKKIKITSGVRYQTGFNDINNSLNFNINNNINNNNNLGLESQLPEFRDTNKDRELLFDYFQNRYNSDLQFLKSKAYEKKKNEL